jgi:Zn-dependent protease
MSWDERPYADGSDSRHPRLSENPLAWSLRLGRLAGIDIRLHILFIIYIVAELIGSGQFLMDVKRLGILFGIVLLHEFGHCFAARAVGGHADEILLWPLGGLAMVRAPQTPSAQFITTACGPLVNVLICLVTAPILVAAGHSLRAVPWNPFHFGASVIYVTSEWHWWVLFTFFLSYVMLLFNLLPMYPLDGGRLLQAILWPRTGLGRAMRIATTAGMVGAVGLGMLGIGTQNFSIIGIAIFGYITCLNERRMLAAGLITDERTFGYDLTGGYVEPRRRGWLTRWRDKQRARRLADEREQERQEAEEVDRILLKVHQHGIQSLTRAEKKTLESATNRRRGPERMRR